MTISLELRNKCNNYDDFIEYLENAPRLIYNKSVEDNIISIEVHYIDSFGDTEFIGGFEFDSEENFINEY